ncbi:MAG TPA: hypothetical protein VLV83_22070, partial [Acidobacteriota bacterium]|nr:hypothetical protein [Acidobacteriota bacterium]
MSANPWPQLLALAVLAGGLNCTRPATTDNPAADENPAAADSPASDEARDAIFKEITKDTGLTFRHQVALEDDYFMPQIIGSGGALFDYDGDGDL